MRQAPAGIRSTRVALLALALAACAGGAGLDAPPGSPGAAHTPAGDALTPQAAIGRIVIGRSSKAEVATELGTAIVIAFDSGYEVWVYRWAGAGRTRRSATELVLLFDPAGTLAKLRLRAGDSARP
ncbi:MAG: hypothetical protein ABW005_13955 [Burkholderiaceae bacterium]